MAVLIVNDYLVLKIFKNSSKESWQPFFLYVLSTLQEYGCFTMRFTSPASRCC